MQVLVDAPVWIDYFTGVSTPETDLLDGLIGTAALVVADLTIAEVLYGLPDERNRRLAEDALRKFWLVRVGGVELSVKSAVSYHTLRARGVETDPLTCLIATYCLENGLALLAREETAEPFVRHLGLGAPNTGQ
ncbi:MAG TPA: PIN domain-containing protein [Thermoanaerobaculia bacterium]|nr:PIN domain-containing protein [Thermoanaerobaculia bacterium]